MAKLSRREFSARAKAYWRELKTRETGLTFPIWEEWKAAGSPSSDGSTLSPDTIWGVRIGRSSDPGRYEDLLLPAVLHDYRYHLGGTWIDKANADVEFYQGIVRLIHARYRRWWMKPIRDLAEARAGIYFHAVSSRFADSHWRWVES